MLTFFKSFALSQRIINPRVLIKRIAINIMTLWVIISVAYVVMKFAPGQPFSQEKALSEATIRALKAKYDFGYWDYLWGILHLDFRYSYAYLGQEVSGILKQALPVSLELGLIALVIATCCGYTLGLFAAINQGKISDRMLMLVAMMGIAIPNFILGPFLQWWLCLQWQILPVAGWDSWSHRILPALTLSAVYTAYIARLTRGTALEVIKQPFMRVAFSKGLTQRQLIFSHLLRHTLTPLVNYLGPATAALLTGALVIEKIYNIPGLGRHFVDSALHRDYPVALGVLICYSVLLLTLNFIVDILQCWIDPRIEFEA